MLKGQKGITLVALVITIIVLLILAGVALATLSGQGNIIGNAENAVNQYQNTAGADQNIINTVDNMLQKYLENYLKAQTTGN